MELEIATCPDCGLPAEVLDRFILPSTDGPVEHLKTRCITGHWFTTPAGYRRTPGTPALDEGAVSSRGPAARRS
jgi:hypothetical protein